MANEATPLEQAMADALDPTGAHHAMNELAVRHEQNKAQDFFASLAASIITPHVGDQYRDTMRNLLLRATEAGLYDPELK